MAVLRSPARSSPTILPRYCRAPPRKQNAAKPSVDVRAPGRNVPNVVATAARTRATAASSGRAEAARADLATKVPGTYAAAPPPSASPTAVGVVPYESTRSAPA
jgi:hypothetical protein